MVSSLFKVVYGGMNIADVRGAALHDAAGGDLEGHAPAHLAGACGRILHQRWLGLLLLHFPTFDRPLRNNTPTSNVSLAETKKDR